MIVTLRLTHLILIRFHIPFRCMIWQFPCCRGLMFWGLFRVKLRLFCDPPFGGSFYLIAPPDGGRQIIRGFLDVKMLETTTFRAWASAAAWLVAQAVLSSGSSSPKRTEHVGLLYRVWSARASPLACWPASLHRWASPCIGRNQAALSTSEQFGEIAHWVKAIISNKWLRFRKSLEVVTCNFC